jgi:hypothetical protein
VPPLRRGPGPASRLYRRTATAKDARRLARRFRTVEDPILRFATRPDLGIFTNNQAERTIRPVKVQQPGSGGARRTLDGLAARAARHYFIWQRTSALVVCLPVTVATPAAWHK